MSTNGRHASASAISLLKINADNLLFGSATTGEVTRMVRTVLSALSAALLVLSAPAMADPVKEKRVAVAPNVILHTVESGSSAKRPPIVFIPGWSAGAEIWRDQIDRFDDKYRVISFDPRSQGRSTKTGSGNTPEERAADLHALLAKERANRPVLVGWSQAVQDLAAYVARYGTGGLSGIVLVDAAVSDGSKAISERPKESAFQFKLLGAYLSSQEEYLRGMFSAIISKQQPPGVIDRAVATGMRTPTSIGVAMLVADMFTVDRTSTLAKMDCPVLVIAARTSPELERQKAQAMAIRDARLVQIDDAAHAVFLDQPDRFAAALEAFLKGIPRR